MILELSQSKFQLKNSFSMKEKSVFNKIQEEFEFKSL